MTDTSLETTTANNTESGEQANAAATTDAKAEGDAAANNQAADTQTGDDGKKTGEDGKAADATDADAAAEGKDAKDGKKADDKPKDDKKADDKPKPKAPEKYDIKVAEGVKIAPEMLTKIEDYARANDLSQEATQALVDLGPEVSKMFSSQLIETAKATSAHWAEQTRNDKELSNGGDKAILDANLALAAKARDAFASKDLLALLADFDPVKNPNGTGFGNHPEIIRLFAKLGKSISEDNKLVTGGASQTEKSASEKLYGNTSKKK